MTVYSIVQSIIMYVYEIWGFTVPIPIVLILKNCWVIATLVHVKIRKRSWGSVYVYARRMNFIFIFDIRKWRSGYGMDQGKERCDIWTSAFTATQSNYILISCLELIRIFLLLLDALSLDFNHCVVFLCTYSYSISISVYWVEREEKRWTFIYTLRMTIKVSALFPRYNKSSSLPHLYIYCCLQWK